MKTRIYQVKNKTNYSFDVFAVYIDNGREVEDFMSGFIYDETRDPRVWSKDKAYQEALEYAKSLEKPDGFKRLVYETGSDDNEGCVKYETE